MPTEAHRAIQIAAARPLNQPSQHFFQKHWNMRLVPFIFQ